MGWGVVADPLVDVMVKVVRDHSHPASRGVVLADNSSPRVVDTRIEVPG